MTLNLKNAIRMERIDIFDKYFNGNLSEEEIAKFKDRLDSDEEFASDFNMYSIIVAGICKEAEQDNADFAAAMTHLTKEQLFEIMGRQSAPVTQEDAVRALHHHAVLYATSPKDLSGVAALIDTDNDDDDFENTEPESKSTEKNGRKSSDNTMRRFTIIFAIIVVLAILMSLIL